MKAIPLSKAGQVALVDDEDYDRLAAFDWLYITSGTSKKVYAFRRFSRGGRRCYVGMHHDVIGILPGHEVDHINGDGLDNRKANLRHATHLQNTRNMRPLGPLSARGGVPVVTPWSRYKGVRRKVDYPRTKPWWAVIQYGGRRHSLGYHYTEEGAARAYDASAREHFGEFAYLNFPDSQPVAQAS